MVIFLLILCLSTTMYGMIDNQCYGGYPVPEETFCVKCESYKRDLQGKSEEWARKAQEEYQRGYYRGLAVEKDVKNSNLSGAKKYATGLALLVATQCLPQDTRLGLGALIAVAGIGATPFTFIKYMDNFGKSKNFLACLGAIGVMPVWIALSGVVGFLVTGEEIK